MQFILKVVRGKLIMGNKEISNYIKTLNGHYTVSFIEENNLATPNNCRAAYFFKVDIVSKHTGIERYDIHNEFKKEYKIESTKDLSVVDWRNLIKQFQVYIFEKLDIII